MDPSLRNRLAILLGVLLVGGGVVAYYWLRPVPLPTAGSPLYVEYLRNFQVGVAALDTERTEIALAKFDKAIELIPGEPASLANRGLYYLRRNDNQAAAKDLKRAHELAPDSGEIEALLGHLER